MWPVLVIHSNPATLTPLSATLADIDHRLRITAVQDVETALERIADQLPLLVILAEPEDSPRAVQQIMELRQHLDEVPILAEVPGEYPLFAIQVLQAGATDTVRTPVASWEWQHRVRGLLDAQRQQQMLAAAIRRATRYLLREREALQAPAVLDILTRADVFRDSLTGRHERRTARFSRLLAEALGLSRRRSRLIEAAATLHDIGQLAIPHEVSMKVGRYSPADRAVMQEHPRLGHAILVNGRTASQQLGAEIALGHHERHDGSGYPQGLAGRETPLAARIVAVADVFEFLIRPRPYRRAVSVEEGLDYLQQHRERLFDPDCVAAFRACRPDIEQVLATQTSWPSAEPQHLQPI